MSTKVMHNDQHQGKSTATTTALSVAPVTRGKRKLNFSSTSSKSSDIHFFRGKKLFLDLPGYNKIDRIEYELTQRGGTVERRFHSGVKYLITNRLKNGGRGAGSQLDSPSTPSPNTPRGGLRSASKFSPCADSPGSVNPLTDNPVSSRAAMILAASKGKKKSTDLTALAESWGCKVLSLNELLKELRKLKPLPKKQETTKKAPVAKVRKLREPFLKVEDVSYSYRPLVYETRHWPHPDVNCSPKGCPFDQGRSHHHTSPKEAAATGDVHKDASSPEAAQTYEDKKRPGYCECCTVRYADLSMHLRSAKHLEYAHNKANFTSLDGIIAKGRTLSEFVKSVRANKGPSSTPPRRSSPRNTASPIKSPSVKSPPRTSPKCAAGHSKEIVLDRTGGILSPRRGQLCLTPIKDSVAVTPTTLVMKKVAKDCTPGFSTPPKSATRRAGSSRIDPVTRALLQNSSRVNSRLLKKKESESVATPTSTRPKTPVKLDPDYVPETPEKNIQTAESPRLANFQTLIDHIAAKAKALSKASVKQRKVLMSDLQALFEEVSRHSPSSPTRSTSITPNVSPLVGVRKSPRLMERELLRFRPSVSSTTEKVMWFTTYKPKSLVVSYDLNRIYPKLKRRSATQSMSQQCSVTPTGSRGVNTSVTPEIDYQGVLPPSRRSKLISESPLMDSTSGDETFYGFSPNTVLQSLPERVQGCVTRKRVLDLSDDDLDDPQLSPPPTKKRRISSEHTGSVLREKTRKSPRLASCKRKLRSSTCD